MVEGEEEGAPPPLRITLLHPPPTLLYPCTLDFIGICFKKKKTLTHLLLFGLSPSNTHTHTQSLLFQYLIH